MKKANELRQMEASKLQDEYQALLREQFNLRMRKGTGQLTQTHILRNVRRSIAQVLTILTEKTGTKS